MMIAGDCLYLMGTSPTYCYVEKSDNSDNSAFSPCVNTQSDDQSLLSNTTWLTIELILDQSSLTFCASVPLCSVLVITQRTILIYCMAIEHRALVLLRVVYPIRILICLFWSPMCDEEIQEQTKMYWKCLASVHSVLYRKQPALYSALQAFYICSEKVAQEALYHLALFLCK